MSCEKSDWRQSSALDYFAEFEMPGSYEYGSSDGRNLRPSSDENERNSNSDMGRTTSTTSSLDGEFEEDEEGSEASDEDSKKKGRKKTDVSDKIIKRRDQNRVSQRAFRQRKERHTKELEAKVENLERLLKSASHENNIVHSQMGRMEEELCYYRHLLFAGARQNRLPLSPSTSHISGPPGYTSNGQQYIDARFSPPELQTPEFSSLPRGHMIVPSLASFESTLAPGSGKAILRTLSRDNTASSPDSNRYTPSSVNNFGTRNQTPASSCSRSPESSTPFQPAQENHNSPVITSPIPNHPNIGNFGASVGGAFSELNISNWNANDETLSAVDGSQCVPGYLHYMSTDSVSWTG